MSYRRLALILASLSLFLGLSACSLAADITPPPNYQPPAEDQSTAQTASYPLVPPDAGQGQAIYTEKCAPCHGDSGMGDGPQAAKLSNPVSAIGSPELARQSVPTDWFTIITNGNLEQYMPGFDGSLSDSQRWNVLAYVYSLSATSSEIQRGQQVYTELCVSCHGATGKGNGPQAASLTTPPTDFTDAAWASNQSLVGLFQVISSGAGQMPPFGDTLSEDDRYAAARAVRNISLNAKSGGASAAVSGTPQPQGTVDATTTETPAAPQPGTITGQISNGSGGTVPAGLEVTLHGFDSMTETTTLTANAQADGAYQFDNIDLTSGRMFMATVSYNDATFTSDIAQVSDDNAPINLPITIYENTTDTSSLSVDRMHVFFDFTNPGLVEVIELYIISNSSNRMVAAGQAGQPVISFDLPHGATNLQFQDGALGQRYIQTDNGFGDTANIVPGMGQHQVLFAYDLPYDNNHLDLALPVPLPVQAAVLMAPEGGVKVKGDQLEDGGTRDVQGTPFHVYNAADLAAGTQFSVSLSGKPTQQGGVVTGGLKSDLIIGLAVFGLALLIAGLYFLRSRTRKAEPAAAETADLPDTTAEDEDADSLMEAIITLDDQYRAGKLPEAAYQQRRAELKARLSEKLQ